MMKNKRENGFVLILVIAIIGLIGAQMFVLGDSSNTILLQSDSAYLEAVERNLIASGLTWAERNCKSEEVFNRPTELEVADMGIGDLTLSVNISVARDKETEVEINTSCSRKRRTRRHSEKYRIKCEP